MNLFSLASSRFHVAALWVVQWTDREEKHKSDALASEVFSPTFFIKSSNDCFSEDIKTF